MKFLRAFISGMAFPAAFLPLALSTIFLLQPGAIMGNPALPVVVLFGPWAWGLWNIAYFAIGRSCPVKGRSARLLATGAALGIIVSLFGVFVLDLPELVLGPLGVFRYLPLIGVPLLYAVLWRYVVYRLNGIVGLEDW